HKMGADVALKAGRQDVEAEVAARTEGLGVDVVLEMSGAPAAIRQAMRICRRGGRVSLMGIPSEPMELDMAEDMIFKGLTVQCIVGRRLYETWETMRARLSSGRRVIATCISHWLRLWAVEHGVRRL